jgi:c-di-GMP-binding flagellar brake protein YcgR
MAKMTRCKFPKVERRRYKRIKDNLYASCFVRPNSNTKFKAVTCNISPGGLMFESEGNIAKGSELKIDIHQPVDSDKKMIFSIPVKAKVIWTKKIDKIHFERGENRYKIGIKFLRIKEKDRKRIAGYIEKAIPKE